MRPMLAAAVDTLPEGPGWAYEPKFDGWRCLAFHREAGVDLRSRTGRPLGGYFPDIAEIVRTGTPVGVVLDGELVVWERDRMSFELLQRRVTAGRELASVVREHPAHYVVFDLLATASGELLDAALAERRRQLAGLLAGAPAQLSLCPQTTDPAQAREWLGDWAAAGVEGVVAKRLDGRYLPGRRGWYKRRIRSTTEAIVGGFTGPPTAPQTLLLGRYDDAGRLRYTGRTHQLSPRQRRELGPLLAALALPAGDAAQPWPQPLPPGWSGHFQRPEPVPYRPVRPALVVEVEVDTAFDRHRWRHAVRYRGARLDLSVADVPILPPGRE